MGFDPLTTLDPVTVIADLIYVVFVNTKVPATTLGRFIDYAGHASGPVFYASSGVGTPPRLRSRRAGCW